MRRGQLPGDRELRLEVLSQMLEQLHALGSDEELVVEVVSRVLAPLTVDETALVLGCSRSEAHRLSEVAAAKWAAFAIRESAGRLTANDVLPRIRRAAERAGVRLGGAACA